MTDSTSQGIRRAAETAVRFGALDPLLSSARIAGLARWGPGLSALVHASALRWPTRVAIIDDRGALRYRRLDEQAESLAWHLKRDGKGPIGVMCRNHRGFLIAQLAAERSGRDLVLLSTALPAEQLRTIAHREHVELIIADREFDDRLADADLIDEVVSSEDFGGRTRTSRLRRGLTRPPMRRSRMIILTSGTTGPPKGARRSNRAPSFRDTSLLDALPIAMNDVTLIASPLFHAWGLAQASIGLSTGSTVVLHRKFDAEATIAALTAHEVTVLAVVPLMLRRILDQASPDLLLPQLRLTLSSGNVLSATLASAWIDRFGANLYNLYGSTETAIASIATPQDLIEAPGTVGRPPKGVDVVILGDDDLRCAPGTVGRVFTGNSMQFDGYTDGSDKLRRGNLMATGDLGYIDDAGRLFVDGRENDLIVTGGENAFPSEIEELLEQHVDVMQAAVVGLPDDDYGQRIAAFIVARPGPAIDVDELRTWMRSRIESFKQPREYHVVEALPMTTTGKVIRHALAALAEPS